MSVGSSRRSRAMPYACTSGPPFRRGRERMAIELDRVAAEDPFAVLYRQIAQRLPARVDDVRIRRRDKTHRPVRTEYAALGPEPAKHALHVRRDVAHGPSFPVSLGHHARQLDEDVRK